MKRLLAIDLGHRSGFAVYRKTEDGEEGRVRLESYRSTNFGSASRMKKAAWGVLRDIDGLAWVVAEGDTTLGAIWKKNARKFDADYRGIAAEEWRDELLLTRHRRSGNQKEVADELARRVIEWAGADRPTSLRHDAAEAILVGLWGVRQAGWIDEEDVQAALEG